MFGFKTKSSPSQVIFVTTQESSFSQSVGCKLGSLDGSDEGSEDGKKLGSEEGIREGSDEGYNEGVEEGNIDKEGITDGTELG